MADARGFKQWGVARRLVARGARTKLVDAATLGLVDRVEAYFAGATAPSPEDITGAFWAPVTAAARTARSTSLGGAPS